MSIYNNFLNTFYKPYKNTIVFANLRNYCEEKKEAFIVYCDAEYIPFNHLPAFLDGYVCNSYKKYLPFRTKRLSGKKLNLYSIFTTLKTYLDNYADRNSPLIDIQKFLFPYYDESIILKTIYSNVLTYDNFIAELNLLYETTEPITADNLLYLKHLIIKGCCPEELKIEINYDFYCPFFKYPIRFVFQYIFPFCNLDTCYGPLERLVETSP